MTLARRMLCVVLDLRCLLWLLFLQRRVELLLLLSLGRRSEGSLGCDLVLKDRLQLNLVLVWPQLRILLLLFEYLGQVGRALHLCGGTFLVCHCRGALGANSSVLLFSVCVGPLHRLERVRHLRACVDRRDLLVVHYNGLSVLIFAEANGVGTSPRRLLLLGGAVHVGYDDGAPIDLRLLSLFSMPHPLQRTLKIAEVRGLQHLRGESGLRYFGFLTLVQIDKSLV